MQGGGTKQISRIIPPPPPFPPVLFCHVKGSRGLCTPELYIFCNETAAPMDMQAPFISTFIRKHYDFLLIQECTHLATYQLI